MKPVYVVSTFLLESEFEDWTLVSEAGLNQSDDVPRVQRAVSSEYYDQLTSDTFSLSNSCITVIRVKMGQGVELVIM